ncbi:MAG: DUF1800 family protein, partial [Verrucomicrobiota bacterium]
SLVRARPLRPGPVVGSSTTDFLFRWQDLNLDGIGGNNDFFDFTIRATTGTSVDVNFNGQGLAVIGNGSGSLDPGDVLTFEIINIQLSPSTIGSVTFDGFTGAGFFASASAGDGNSTTATASGDVNGNNVVVNLSGTGYTFDTTPIDFGSPAASVVFDNAVKTPGTATPTPFARHFDLQFSYSGSSGSGLPPHGITLDPENEDLDSNGLADLWEALYGAHGVDADADSDGDGLSNRKESGFGTDPFDPNSTVDFAISKMNDTTATVEWSFLSSRPGQLQSTTDLGATDPWGPHAGAPYIDGGMRKLNVDTTGSDTFFRLMPMSEDLDSDGIADHLEPALGFTSNPGDADSAFQSQSYDTTGNGIPDTTISGDLAAYNEIYRVPEAGTALTRAQAARLLLQTSFGPSDMALVDYVASIGPEAWIDEQIAVTPTHHQDYIEAIKADFDAPPADNWTDPALSGYYINGGGGGNPFVSGTNYDTAWLRASMAGNDQLRQRVAFALSQILVASRRGMLFHQVRTTANYYDMFVDQAFGNFEDLLLDVSLHPFMGHWLSHIGNQKADIPNGIYPDENYAREIMQLFSIGLWELYPDGTRVLDGNGEPIETYDTTDITNVAEVFTGVNFNETNFGQWGWRDDGDSANQYMITPMKLFGSHHDFTAKNIPNGIQMSGGQPVLDIDGNPMRVYHQIPARSQSDANALQDVEDCVNVLVNHPNCGPFICRQLIQFLVSSNPSPAYVERVANVFKDNGSGVTGDLEAVVKAILLDDEARNPQQHLETPYFGHLREPVIRMVHLGRMLEIDDHDDLIWWFFEDYFANIALQEPMYSPSVFNFYRPDYSLFGQLSDNNLDSPAFGIVNSYTAISFPNYLWRMCEIGLRFYSGNPIWYDGKDFPPDLSNLEAIAGSIPDLLDHLSILYCGGTLGAESRATITAALQSVESDGSISAANKNLEKARLGAYLVLMSPEGTCTK